jgi:hypothetical protein
MGWTKSFASNEDLGKGVNRFHIRALEIMLLDAK